MSQSIASPMSKNTSFNKDSDSDTSQLPISQEFLKAIPGSIFQIASPFLFYGISGASCWHKVTPDEHRQFHRTMLCFAFNHSLLEARREKKGAQGTKKKAPIAPLQHPLLDPRRDRMPGKTTFCLTQLASPMCLHFAPSIRHPINAQTYLSRVMRSRGQRHIC